MAKEEAVIRIVLQGDGGFNVSARGAAAQPPNAPSPSSYTRPPDRERSVASPSGSSDQIPGVLGSMAGLLGGLASKVLGVVSAAYKSQIDLAKEMQKTTAATIEVRDAIKSAAKPESPSVVKPTPPSALKPWELTDEEKAAKARGIPIHAPMSALTHPDESQDELAKEMRGGRIPTAKAAPPKVYPVGEEVVAGGLGELAAAVAPVVGIALAVKAVADYVRAQIIGGIKGTVGAAGDIASGIASASDDPSVPIRAAGDATSRFGEKIATVLPELGFMAVAAGETGKALSGLMQNLDKTAERYGEYSPLIAQQQALVDVNRTMGDLRRSQQIGPELARYVQTQGELQQKFEDIKIALLQRILAVFNPLLEGLEKMVPSEQAVGAMVSVLSPLSGIASAINTIVGMQQDDRFQEVADPTTIILQGAGPNLVGMPGDPGLQGLGG